MLPIYYHFVWYVCMYNNEFIKWAYYMVCISMTSVVEYQYWIYKIRIILPKGALWLRLNYYTSKMWGHR